LNAICLYIDHHVNSAITEGLRLRDVDCLTAEDDFREDWEDEELLERATSLERAFVTQDEDFLVLAAEWNEASRSFSGIIYSHQLRITIGQAIRDIEMVCKADVCG